MVKIFGIHFLPQKIDLPRFPLDQRTRGRSSSFSGNTIVPSWLRRIIVTFILRSARVKEIYKNNALR